MPLSTLSRSIRNRVAIITGAASGMGRATALLFADEGARLAIVDRSADALATVERDIADAGGTVRAWSMDVSQPDVVEAMVDEAHAHYGAIDIIVNNAGISAPAAIDGDAWRAQWDTALAVNLTAQARLIRAPCSG